MNGINGGAVPSGMVGMPAPAGHQAELNYIYGMVEELSRQLAENRRQTEEIVSGVGRVRQRARAHGLSNEELINAAADELNSQQQNLELQISALNEALEKSKYSRDANMGLLQQYATVMSAMLRQFHEYKASHVADVSSWHRSYRAQLAEAREENSRLREQIWDMQAAAGRANDALRTFRGKYEEDESRWERRVEAVAVRQEIRFWKRLAMPHIPDDDPYWSDDDDLIDARERIRLRNLEERRRQDQLAQQAQQAQQDAESEQPHAPVARQAPTLIGAIPMQREDSSGGVPMQPPRPPSVASSTGSSGQ